MVQVMPLRIRDIPPFPDYIPGQTDHQFMAAARAQGPLAKDDYGIISAFSAAHMAQINDDRWTRQIELETMRADGVTGGAMFDFVRDVMLFSNGATHRNRRAPLVRTFAHKVMAELRPEVAARVTALIAPLAGRGSVDFAEAVAGPIPAQKRLLALASGDARWAATRPPLLPMAEAAGRALAGRLAEIGEG